MSNFYWHDKDPYDERIRQTLKEWEEAPPAQWDVPPPGLWDKIAPAVATKAATGTGLALWLKWLLGASLAAGVTVVGMLYFNRSEQVVPPQVQAAPPIAAPTPLAEQAPAEAPTPSQGTPVPVSPSIAPIALSKQPNASNRIAPATSQPASTLIPSIPDREAVALPTTAAHEKNATGQETAGELPQAVASPPMAGIDLLAEDTPAAAQAVSDSPLLPPPADEETTLPPTPLSVPPLMDVAAMAPCSPSSQTSPYHWPVAGLTRRAKLPRRFYAGATVAANHTFREITSSVRPVSQLPPYLRDNEFAAWTSEWGVKLGWQPTQRLWLSTGVSLYSMGQQSRHTFRIPFDPGRERPGPNGERQGQYNLTVPSAYGDAGVVVSVQRPAGQQVPQGQLLTVNMQTGLHIRYVTLPLSGYYFPLWGRFSAGVKGGVALNFLQEQRLNVHTNIAARGLSARVVSVRQSEELVQRTVADYHVGTALWYRPSPRWAIALEPSYRRSLGPVLRREFFNVDQYAWSIQVGVQKFF